MATDKIQAKGLKYMYLKIRIRSIQLITKHLSFKKTLVNNVNKMNMHANHDLNQTFCQTDKDNQESAKTFMSLYKVGRTMKVIFAVPFMLAKKVVNESRTKQLCLYKYLHDWFRALSIHVVNTESTSPRPARVQLSVWFQTLFHLLKSFIQDSGSFLCKRTCNSLWFSCLVNPNLNSGI